ncbi:MAG: hypothetical protein HYT78_11285 [Deltaproteobacteria bacterium]|nr:hypothetical protein [Deltaproteobacteria bacterium]
MDLIRLDRSDAAYPTALNHYLGKDAPSSIAILGDPQALKADKLALFCSVKCPAKLILQTHDLAHELVQGGVTVIGGFHSPVEKECLRVCDNRHRSDIQMSLYRNRFVAALADWILIPYAGPSSKTEQFCSEILAWQKPVYTFSHVLNENLITRGARPLTPGEEVEMTLRSLERG